jgi:nitrite reductase/ring-hydroxylating ferredoxin subunit
MLAAAALTGCGGSPSSPSSGSTPPLPSATATVAGRVVAVNIESTSPLAAVGSAATVETSRGTFLIARTGQDSFAVLTATCTHEGCTINGFADSRFVCPCHGSQFNSDGSVANGPASSSLQRYPAQFTDGLLTFTA